MLISTVSVFYNATQIVKRTFFMCVFFTVVACSDAVNTPENTSVEITEAQQPLLSLSELLAADDVRQGLANASITKDIIALETWQTRLLSAADEVYLVPSERKLISGKQGLMFLEFQGMKINYQEAFDKAFFNFEDVNEVFVTYPAFESLHEKGRDLVRKRDQLILQTKVTLEERGYTGDTLAEAKNQWQAAMSQHNSSQHNSSQHNQ
ncbi:hypothetical protein [Agaribacter marinus]|uniref:Uncharacterized protein n=1 Tax=Agaribacter marinus TaxID=1431249 RepID=A0AA37SVE2_9ALTE|nr:hypothetical protein [Agaribacter marinus]GLR70183.1 hypothetical protein GCM10007852_10910 [Agaribacter marinus]